MTPPGRALSTSAGLLVVLALAVSGCATGTGTGQQPQTSGSDGDGAQGQLGAASTPDPAPTPTDPPTPTPEATTEPPLPEDEPAETPGPGLTFLTINPNILQLLTWPTPADCVEHNPANLTISASGGVYRVVDGSHLLLAYKRQVDAEAALALAKSYRRHCFVGRGTPQSEPNRHRFILDYWLDPVGGAPAPPYVDCIPFDQNNLTVEAITFEGANRWRVNSGSQGIHIFYTQSDANDAVKVYRHYNRTCYIGRGYDGPDRLEYITDYQMAV